MSNPPADTKQKAIDALIRRRSNSLEGVSETPDRNTIAESKRLETEQKNC